MGASAAVTTICAAGAHPRRPILGCDPGVNGALALLRPDGSVGVHDIPILDTKPRRTLDLWALSSLFDELAKEAPDLWIELVGARPTDGCVQAFSFGGMFWALKAMAAAHFMPINEVAPVRWRRAVGLRAGEDKDCSRALASKLYPRAAHYWPLKKHDGRSESLLIAHYGAQQQQLRSAA